MVIMNEEKSLRKNILDYANKKFGNIPEYLWFRFPQFAVLRHTDNGKWYAIIMDVPREKLGLAGSEKVDILNVKMRDSFFVDFLISRPGYMRGYHISRGNWVSVLLDGTVPPQEIFHLIDESYEATASKKKLTAIRPPKEWIIPANPKYYDVVGAFNNAREIDWKQNNGVKVGDTVFLYVAAPVSAILYKCRVTKTDIPFTLKDKNINIKSLMRIKLLKSFKPDDFTFARLKAEYGIFAVRGPRSVPNSLSESLKRSK